MRIIRPIRTTKYIGLLPYRAQVTECCNDLVADVELTEVFSTTT